MNNMLAFENSRHHRHAGSKRAIGMFWVLNFLRAKGRWHGENARVVPFLVSFWCLSEKQVRRKKDGRVVYLARMRRRCEAAPKGSLRGRHFPSSEPRSGGSPLRGDRTKEPKVTQSAERRQQPPTGSNA
jgi:hypothetical protein